MNYSALATLDDAALMYEVQRGNGDALAVLYDRYWRVVMRVALGILSDRSEAENVAQDVFLEVWRKAAQFDPAKGRFYSWLMQYAYHRSLNRKEYLQARRYYEQDSVEEMTDYDHAARGMYAVSALECKRFVREALALLNGQQRRAVELVHFEGLTLQESAERTGETLSNARHYYYRGLKRMRECLEEG